MFGTQARNDGSAYTFTDSIATLTLPSSNLADGYLIIVRMVLHDTSSGRVSITGRVQQTGGTGNFVNFQTGGYSRDALNDDCYHSCGGFVDNPSASATFQYQWERESDPPTGGTTKSSFDVIPFFYSDIAMYDGSDLGAYNGTTPNVTTIANTVLEGTNITRTGNVVTVTGDRKRYFIMSSQWWQNRGSNRTQRILGLDVDGSQVLGCQGVSYHKQASADGVGCHIHHLIETVEDSRTIEVTSYRGDGVANGDGGCDVDGQTPTQGQQGLVVIELNNSAEVFQTSDATGLQALDSATPLDINAVRTTDFIDSDSWSKVGTVGMENNKGASFDALTGANVWAASTNVNLDQRGLYEGNITVDGVEDADVFHGSYMRGEQSTFDQFGIALNPIGWIDLADNEDLGVSTTQIGQTNVPDTQAGTVGMWGINIDSMPQVDKDVIDTVGLEINEGVADLLARMEVVDGLDLSLDEVVDLLSQASVTDLLDLEINEDVAQVAVILIAIDNLDLSIEEGVSALLGFMSPQDLFDLAILEGDPSIFVDGNAQDDLDIDLVEAAELLTLAEVLDTLGLEIVEGPAQIAIMVDVLDTLGLTVVEETADLLGLIQPVDTTGLTLEEVVQVFTTAERLDTLGISISEVADLLGLMSRTDLLDLEIVEGPALVAGVVAAEDTLDLDITEGPSEVLVAIANEDTLDLSLVEQVDLLGFIQRSDTVALTIVEGVPLLLVRSTATDLVDLEIVEDAGQVTVGITGSDLVDLEVVEAVAELTVSIQASDLLDLSVDEVAILVGFLNRTDILDLSLDQPEGVIVFIQAVDDLGIEILDASQLLNLVQVADDLDLDLTEVASVLNTISVLDTLDIDLTEDPGDVVISAPFQGILVQPFTLVVCRTAKFTLQTTRVARFTLQIEGSGEQRP